MKSKRSMNSVCVWLALPLCCKLKDDLYCNEYSLAKKIMTTTFRGDCTQHRHLLATNFLIFKCFTTDLAFWTNKPEKI